MRNPSDSISPCIWLNGSKRIAPPAPIFENGVSGGNIVHAEDRPDSSIRQVSLENNSRNRLRVQPIGINIHQTAIFDDVGAKIVDSMKYGPRMRVGVDSRIEAQ